ncbi:TPA: hypothetical protein N0F65_010673 [Lagenidium giganteum]|uniref:MULE transposase domain-containing protein n=1 Tax=Lagenidium giganteum TaxID=4803 RepID=A0AAV2Z9Z2_9STRA|nr:TPA: hypothetical protein N0F65_010673 [Lagenidium giganteum]
MAKAVEEEEQKLVSESGPGEVDSDYDDGTKAKSDDFDDTEKPSITKSPVSVPAMMKLHASWPAFQEYLEDYQRATFQALTVKDTLNCEIQNKCIAAQKYVLSGATPQYIADVGGNGITDDQAVEILITHFLAADQNNVAAVDETPDGLTGVILITSRLMREMFARFLEVRVRICIFHVLQYLKTEVREPKYGKLSKDDYESFDNIIHNMVYAATEEEYEGHREDFNFSGKLKELTSCNGDMRTLLDTLIRFAAREENAYVHSRCTIGMRRNTNFDQEMNYVLRWTTHFVADKIAAEYLTARNKGRSYAFEETQQAGLVAVVTVHHPVEYIVVHMCFHVYNMKLPYRHVIAYRIQAGRFDHVVPIDMFDESYTFCVQLTTYRQCIAHVLIWNTCSDL